MLREEIADPVVDRQRSIRCTSYGLHDPVETAVGVLVGGGDDVGWTIKRLGSKPVETQELQMGDPPRIAAEDRPIHEFDAVRRRKHFALLALDSYRQR